MAKFIGTKVQKDWLYSLGAILVLRTILFSSWDFLQPPSQVPVYIQSYPLLVSLYSFFLTANFLIVNFVGAYILFYCGVAKCGTKLLLWNLVYLIPVGFITDLIYSNLQHSFTPSKLGIIFLSFCVRVFYWVTTYYLRKENLKIKAELSSIFLDTYKRFV